MPFSVLVLCSFLCVSLSRLRCPLDSWRGSRERQRKRRRCRRWWIPLWTASFPAECVQWARARSWNLANETHPPEGPVPSHWLRGWRRRRRLADGGLCKAAVRARCESNSRYSYPAWHRVKKLNERSKWVLRLTFKRRYKLLVESRSRYNLIFLSHIWCADDERYFKIFKTIYPMKWDSVFYILIDDKQFHTPHLTLYLQQAHYIGFYGSFATENTFSGRFFH